MHKILRARVTHLHHCSAQDAAVSRTHSASPPARAGDCPVWPKLQWCVNFCPWRSVQIVILSVIMVSGTQTVSALVLSFILQLGEAASIQAPAQYRFSYSVRKKRH